MLWLVAFKEGADKVDGLLWQYANADVQAQKAKDIQTIASNWGVSIETASTLYTGMAATHTMAAIGGAVYGMKGAETSSAAKGTTVGGKPITFDGEFYSVDGLKFSKSYYDRLWEQGRPAPFIQAKEVLGSNPKVMPDPRGAPGYFKYEGAGLEMIYNPTTGQVGHIQPIKVK